MSKVYIAFFGCGKTTFCKKHVNWVDLDISFYVPFRDQKALHNLLYFYLKWDYNLLLCSSPSGNRILQTYLSLPENSWQKQTFPINVILPSPEMKDEILQRVMNRSGAIGSEINFITSTYDTTWQALDTMPFDTKVYLKPGQYVSDIIDDEGNYKPNVEIIYPNKC